MLLGQLLVCANYPVTRYLDILTPIKVVSGARAFQLLTKSEQDFALNTEVQYAPRAYEWMRNCRATEDGLSIAKVGDERSLDDLLPWTWEKVQSLPVSPVRKVLIFL